MATNYKEIIFQFKNKWVLDIRFWIIVFFILRLYGITNAPLEVWHNWRQTFTNEVARNFLEVDNTIFYPRANIYGNKGSVVGTEFPLLNYLIYLVSLVFGYAHWYGRLINLVVSSFGIYFFYKIVSDFLKPNIAFNASIVLICSVWFAFSRKSMPDTFSISLVVIGMYQGLKYLYSGRLSALIGFVIITSLGVLSKMPGLYLLTLFIIPLLDTKPIVKTKFLFCLGSLLVFILMSVWYFYWVPYLQSLYGNQLFFPKGILEGLRELLHFKRLTAEKFYFSSLNSFTALAFFLVGLFYIIKRKDKIMFSLTFISSLVFFMFMIKTGNVFSQHNYYIIPFTPIMALVVAFGLNEIKYVKLKYGILVLIAIEAIANQQHDFKIKDSQFYKLELENIADRVSSKNDLIAINGGENPQQLYFTHRKGWRINNEDINNLDAMTSMQQKGCKFLFLNKNLFETPMAEPLGNWEKVYNDRNFVVFSSK